MSGVFFSRLASNVSRPRILCLRPREVSKTSFQFAEVEAVLHDEADVLALVTVASVVPQ